MSLCLPNGAKHGALIGDAMLSTAKSRSHAQIEISKDRAECIGRAQTKEEEGGVVIDCYESAEKVGKRLGSCVLSYSAYQVCDGSMYILGLPR